MIDWPQSLPQCPVVNGFSMEMKRDIAAFAPDAGVPHARQRSTVPQALITVAYRMTYEQVQFLDGFYNDTCGAGSLPFTWFHPLYFNDAFVCVFNEPPKVTRFAPNAFQVTFSLLAFEDVD